MVESVFSALKTTLENGEDIKISGFGKFEVKNKHERKGRNPQTGEFIIIDARRILSFKPSTILKESINGK
jgi:integration host factor subunit alpha